MSVSVRADGSGTFGALMLNCVDKFILNADSTLSGVANPATGVRSNVLATMQKFADEFGALLSPNGYQKLPSGLIIQWGLATPTVAGVTITLPVTNPTALMSVIMGNGDSTSNRIYTATYTLNSFQAFATVQPSSPYPWFAVGY